MSARAAILAAAHRGLAAVQLRVASVGTATASDLRAIARLMDIIATLTRANPGDLS